MKNKINASIALGILILASIACSFSTANLSELKFGKDKDASGAGTTFKPEDEIFAVTAVNNASGKNKAKFRVLFDKVEGAETGAVAYKLEKELEVEGSRPIWLNFSVPTGIVPGTYKTEVVLNGEDGKELDRKTGTFTVTGESPNKTAKTDKQSSDETNSETDEDKDSDDK
jgi:hypothetical protein